ncbi:unnamed protein product [Brassica napus]|uniref:(rape) hypothetical protein n=1 Tax=Brassica napus TaxID=3708 RepID=A0A816NWQ7_BRANA|nr:unnamed protein product [Brassica napus]CAF2351358.1 unnamed protein product [Brassica napus]
MVRWYLDDDDDEDEYEDDLLKPERLLQRTDRSAGWHHLQFFSSRGMIKLMCEWLVGCSSHHYTFGLFKKK